MEYLKSTLVWCCGVAMRSNVGDGGFSIEETDNRPEGRYAFFGLVWVVPGVLVGNGDGTDCVCGSRPSFAVWCLW